MEGTETTTHALGTREHIARIRELNDAVRMTLIGGIVVATPGFRGLDKGARIWVLHQLALFTSFEKANDPYGEHDFGAIQIEGSEKIFWKIDCYDKDVTFGSPDAADPKVTTRVLTLMLASEY